MGHLPKRAAHRVWNQPKRRKLEGARDLKRHLSPQTRDTVLQG